MIIICGNDEENYINIFFARVFKATSFFPKKGTKSGIKKFNEMKWSEEAYEYITIQHVTKMNKINNVK